MVAGRRIGPFAGRALAGFRSVQPDEQGATGRVCERRRPASSGLRGGRWRDNGGTPPRHRARDGAPVRRLETTSCPPHAAALSAMRTSGYRSITLARIAVPSAPVGTNRRSFHEMISEIRPIAFSRSTMPSVKPESSMRKSPMTLTRRSSSPSSSCKTVRPSSTATKASAGLSVGASTCVACATQAGETRRPMMRSPSSVWSR